MFKGDPKGPAVNVELKYKKKNKTAGDKYRDIELRPKKVLPAKVLRSASKSQKKKRGASAKRSESKQTHYDEHGPLESRQREDTIDASEVKKDDIIADLVIDGQEKEPKSS